MCGGTPSVQQSNPEADAQRAADKAAKLANAQRAARKRQATASSVMVTGGQGVTTAPPLSSVMATAYSKETLGA
jgi:hypothetical protein